MNATAVISCVCKSFRQDRSSHSTAVWFIFPVRNKACDWMRMKYEDDDTDDVAMSVLRCCPAIHQPL